MAKKKSKISKIQEVINRGLTDKAKAELAGIIPQMKSMNGPGGMFQADMPIFGNYGPISPLSTYTTSRITLNKDMPFATNTPVVLNHEELHALDANTHGAVNVNNLANSKGFAAILKANDPEAYQKLLTRLQQSGYSMDQNTLDSEMFAYYGERGTETLLTNPAVAKFYNGIYKPMSVDKSLAGIPKTEASMAALEKIYRYNLAIKLNSLTESTKRAIQTATKSGDTKIIENIQRDAEQKAEKIKEEEYNKFQVTVGKAKPAPPTPQSAAMKLFGSDNDASQRLFKTLLESRGVQTKGMFPTIEKEEAKMASLEADVKRAQNAPAKKTSTTEANSMIREMLQKEAQRRAIEDADAPVKITGLSGQTPGTTQYNSTGAEPLDKVPLSTQQSLQDPQIQAVVDNAIQTVPPNMKEAAQQAIPLIMKSLDDRGILSPNVLAYALATVQHESGFRPIGEIQGVQQAEKLGYDGGAKYMGRGYIQITGLYNYQKIGDAIGVDLVNNPTLLLDPTISAKALAAYFDLYGTAKAAESGDFVNARKTVNGGEFNTGSNVPYSIATQAQTYKDFLPQSFTKLPTPTNNLNPIKKTVEKSKSSIFDPITDMIQQALGGVQSLFVKPVQASSKQSTTQRALMSTQAPNMSTNRGPVYSAPRQSAPASRSSSAQSSRASAPSSRVSTPAPRSTPAAANMSTNRGPAVSSQVYRAPQQSSWRPAPTPAPTPRWTPAPKQSKPTPKQSTAQNVFKAIANLFTWGKWGW